MEKSYLEKKLQDLENRQKWAENDFTFLYVRRMYIGTPPMYLIFSDQAKNYFVGVLDLPDDESARKKNL